MSKFFGNSGFQYIIHKVSIALGVITVAVVVIVIIMLMMDLAKAVMSNDADANKKALSVAKSRIIAIVIFLLIPTIATFSVNIASGESISYLSSDYSSEQVSSYGNLKVMDGYIDFQEYVKVGK